MLHRVVDPQLSPSEALTTPQFWLLWALFFLNSHVVSFLATFWKVCNQTASISMWAVLMVHLRLSCLCVCAC